jgi:phosphatidylglycerol:prolipoprotein diacylglycerol transferase
VQPTLDIGPITLQTFGICFALAFVASGALVARRLRELGHPRDWAYEVVFSALVGGLIGSRIDYIIQNFAQVQDDLVGALFSGSGLVWFGGLVGGAAGVLIWARLRGYLGLQLLDVCAPALALGYAVGRVGCQLSGDGDYGVASDVPWAMSYPDGTVPTAPGEEVHPTPVYETLVMGLAALLLWRLRDRFRPGTLFAIYLLISGVERFLIEIIRRNDAVLGGLTLAQLVSIGLIVVSVAWLARPGALTPASPAA